MSKINPQSFAAVINGYLASPKFKSLSGETQKLVYRYLVQAQHPDTLGAYPAVVMRPALVQAFLDAYADRPGAQQNVRSAIGYLEKWALVRDLLPHPILTGTECVGSNGGHKPWTNAQVALAEQHARPEIARLVTLASNTGQRGSDLYRMHPKDVETIDGRPGINVMRQKNGDWQPIWIPMTEPLIAAMKTWERRPAPFLLHPSGRPWKDRQELTMAWTRERDRNPHLKDACAGLVLHGLRATAVVRLRRAGCTSQQISDMIGLSVQMIERYCRFADQKKNAIAALDQLQGTGQEQEHNKVTKFPARRD
jgi:integrase